MIVLSFEKLYFSDKYRNNNFLNFVFQSGTEGYQQYNQISPSRSPSGPTYTQLSGGSARAGSNVAPPSQGNSYHPPPTAQGMMMVITK